MLARIARTLLAQGFSRIAFLSTSTVLQGCNKTVELQKRREKKNYYFPRTSREKQKKTKKQKAKIKI